MTDQLAAAAVMAARTRLVLAQPFFGALALRLQPRPDPSCRTAWTDGRTLAYSPEYVSSLQPAEVQGLIAHEVLHVALGHPWRRDLRDAGKWNTACDHAVNPVVREAGMVLPPGGLSDPTPEYPGLAAEEIYTRLPEPDRGEGGGEGGGEGAPSGSADPEQGDADYGPGAVRDAPGTEAARATDWADTQTAVRAAVQAARGRGNLPGGLDRLVSEALRPRCDWRALLHQFVQRTMGREDYSWRAPNPRYTHLGVYLPSLESETCPPLVVAVDTSGSIDEATLQAFLAELRALHEEMRPEILHLWWADAAVVRAEEYGPDDALDPRPAGGGGTDFRPVCARADGLERPPACVVYLTDGDGTYPDLPAPWPTLWVMTTDRVAPWGETIRLEEGA